MKEKERKERENHSNKYICICKLCSVWARNHAQDYILEYFRLLSDRRKAAHATAMERLAATSYYRFGTQPHPAQVAEAQAHLKRGIDEDWQASVQRYPEVLDYFFAQVALSLPDDDDPAVRDPPLSALNGARKAARRTAAPNTVPPPPPPPAAIGLDPFPLSPPPPPPQAHFPPQPQRRLYPRYGTPGPAMRYGY